MFTRPCLLLVLAALPLRAQAPPPQDELLERLIGDWVLEGPMAGGNVVHDVTFSWMLQHLYVRMQERSREREADGRRAYEAEVLIGRDDETGGYAAMWLDVTGGGGIRGDGIGHAPLTKDALPFVFHFPDGTPFYTTFIYDRTRDQWRWEMDGMGKDGREPFARVTLRRAPPSP
ncbi:MAG: hypothetical protein OEW77_10350 [Gemmatimonadota bacterium]|nr:hypothetical protein [Gemmatimonadota bacterium]